MSLTDVLSWNFLDGGISLLGQSLVVPYTLTAPLS